MSDILLPPNIRMARATLKYVDSTGKSRGMFGGQTRTAVFGGDRLAATLEFTPHGGPSGQAERAQLKAFLAQLRGAQNRACLYDASYVRRGSFPASELLTNNTFANGTTGWTVSLGTLTVQDRVARLSASSGGSQPQFYQNLALTQYVPYALRSFIYDGQGTSGLSAGPLVQGSAVSGNDYSVLRGLRTAVVVSDDGSAHFQYPAVIVPTSGYSAGSSIFISYTSLSRCALVDNGPNLLVRSDAIDNASWTKNNATINADFTAAPDGTTTADLLVDNVTSGTHYAAQSITVSSSAQDYCFCAAIKASAQPYAWIQMLEATGSFAVLTYIKLSDGSFGSSSTGTNWSNLRRYSANLGNGWYYVCIVARKTNAATGINAYIGSANADGGNSYSGPGSGAIYIWRATLSQSSVPTRLSQTTSAASSGSSQTGSALYVKGLPVSTNGLLLAGDQIEVITSRGSELKLVTAALNSDAAGLGYLQFEPPLRVSPADNAAVIINQPMGRFLFSGDLVGWDEQPGFITTASADFEEAA